MQLHQLKPKHKNKKKKRIGRGGKRGTYSGRGVKGQKARAGSGKVEPAIRRLIKKYPKLRGYKEKPNQKLQAIVNVQELEKKFNDGDLVNPKSLIKKGIINKIKNRVPTVKILGKGKITKELEVESCKVSKGAREKIEKVKGKIKESSSKDKPNKKTVSRKKTKRLKEEKSTKKNKSKNKSTKKKKSTKKQKSKPKKTKPKKKKEKSKKKSKKSKKKKSK